MATALDASYPYDGVDAFEAEWRDMFRALGSGVVAGLDNELAPFADSSGRQVKVSTGRIWAAGQFGKNTSQKMLAIATNGSGQPRIDRIVARNLFGSGIELDILTGTPGSSPVPPTLTSDSTMQEFPLAQVGPLASGFTTVAAGQIFDERYFISLNGPPAYATAGQDLTLWTPLAVGMIFTGRDDGGLYWWDGAAGRNLRRQDADIAFTPSGNEDVTAGFITWPSGLSVNVAVPAWATKAKCFAKIGQVTAVTGTLDHQVFLTLGSITVAGQKIEWDLTFMPSGGSAEDIILAGTVDVTAIRGTTVAFGTTADRVSGSGALRADVNSASYAELEFS